MPWNLFQKMLSGYSVHNSFVCGIVRYIGALGARVICDNIPGLVNKQRQLCQRHPDIMQAIGEGTKEWIRECQHQFRHHRWNCSTLDRDHTVFGRVLLRSKSMCLYWHACLMMCVHWAWLLSPICCSLASDFHLSSVLFLLLPPVFASHIYVCCCAMFTITNGLL